jgi:BirA family biotin operon repressor/biotin-[acetyl-CoA-carboxylase] ligase
MLFNIESFDIKLNTEFIGRNFIYTEEIDSTNTFLLNKENKFNSNGTVLLAEKQNKGRGRNNRVWYSSKGHNLTFSILLTDKKYFDRNFNLLNFVSSLSLATALENLFQLRIDLKWPNDILVGGKKIAGILLESISQGNKIKRLVIGVGVNVNQTFFQGNFNIPPTSLKVELNESVEREKMLAEYLNSFEETLNRLESFPDEVLRDWKSRCGLIGEKISVTDGDKIKYGIFDDIDKDGYLLLKNKGEIEKIHFGELNV